MTYEDVHAKRLEVEAAEAEAARLAAEELELAAAAAEQEKQQGTRHDVTVANIV